MPSGSSPRSPGLSTFGGGSLAARVQIVLGLGAPDGKAAAEARVQIVCDAPEGRAVAAESESKGTRTKAGGAGGKVEGKATKPKGPNGKLKPRAKWPSKEAAAHAAAPATPLPLSLTPKSPKSPGPDSSSSSSPKKLGTPPGTSRTSRALKSAMKEMEACHAAEVLRLRRQLDAHEESTAMAVQVALLRPLDCCLITS